MTEQHLVAVVALEGVVPFDLGTPTQIFGTARDEHGHRKYDVRVCTPGGQPVRASAGYLVTPDHGLELTERADTVVVSGISYGDPVENGGLDPAVAEALRNAHARGARVMSICTGAFVLAAAGLLDDRPATTHWWWAERFRELFPHVKLDRDVLFVDGGDVLTSAGTFTRRFRDETGVSPARWLLQQRVDHARALLESTDLPVEVVARRSGLGTAAGLRQHLQSAIGVAPSAYRRTFRVVPESAGG